MTTLEHVGWFTLELTLVVVIPATLSGLIWAWL